MGIEGYDMKPGAPCTTGSTAHFAFARVVAPALSVRSKAVMRVLLVMTLVGDIQRLLAYDAQNARCSAWNTNSNQQRGS